MDAVYYNAIQEMEGEEREAFVAAKRREYSEDVDLLRLASDIVVDAVVQPKNLRHELATRLDYLADKRRHFSDRRHGVPPV